MMPSPPSLAEIRARRAAAIDYMNLYGAPDADNCAVMDRLITDDVEWLLVALADTEAERDAYRKKLEAFVGLFEQAISELPTEESAYHEDFFAVSRAIDLVLTLRYELARLRALLAAAPSAPVERDAAAGEAQRLREAAQDALDWGDWNWNADSQKAEERLREALSSVPLSGGPPAGVTLTAEQADRVELRLRGLMMLNHERYLDEHGGGSLADCEHSNCVADRAALALLRPPAAEGTT